MNRREISLIAANAAAIAQRQRMRQRIEATGERLKFSRLSFDARQSVERRIAEGAHGVADQAKAHPVIAGFGIAALIAWLFREPIIDHAPRHLRALIERISGHPAFSNADLSDDLDPQEADYSADEPLPPPANDTDA